MDSEQAAAGPAYWATLSIEDALARLEASRDGLSIGRIAERQRRYGSNRLPRPARWPWYVDLAANFFHLFALLLWCASVLAWMVGEPLVAEAIVAVIVVNGLFGYWQEYQAERAVQALEALLPQQVTVRRDGAEKMVSASEIVPGDVLLLTEGETVPADSRVIVAERLRVDTSALTGESRPMPRIAHSVPVEGKTFTTLPNLVFAGTNVVSGRGEAVVFAIGAASEFGRIANLTHVQRERPSPLQKEVKWITRLITVLAIGMGALFFGLGTAFGGLSPAAGFIFTLGIIVANVPEGLLPTLTLALALAVRRMASRNALVKRLAAVETLGAATVILTDKTGTLTENEMTVRELWTIETHYLVSGVGYEPTGAVQTEDGAPDSAPELTAELLRVAALCCDARLVAPHEGRRSWTAIGDPTEAAILVAAAKAGLGADKLGVCPRLAELPFDSTRKRMTTIEQIGGAPVACVKGALSHVLPLCAAVQSKGGIAAMTDAVREKAHTAHDSMANRGLRVLAVAMRNVDSVARPGKLWRAEEVERELTFLGLVAMEDPPRREVPDAVAACKRAGIRVVMVTGDDPLTAVAIGREIGLCRSRPQVVTGAELDGLDDAKLAPMLETPELLFARVAPEHKLRLVQAYQRTGSVVAVTGDGVNDAPALKLADIGVAMGATGSDVAREAADVVLADDNFASIVAAVEEGRTVYDNVRKFLTYVLAHNVPEAATFVAFVLAKIPLPLTVMQVLAIDLGTDLLPALALGKELPEHDVMERPPRLRSERLLDRGTALRVYSWLGLLESGLVLSAYFFAFWLGGWRPGTPLAAAGELYRTATTMTFAGIVACQVGNAFACRTRRGSIFTLGFTTNRTLLLGISAELIVLGLLIYVPQFAVVFGFAPLRAEHWILLAAFGPIMLTLDEGRRALLRSHARQR